MHLIFIELGCSNRENDREWIMLKQVFLLMLIMMPSALMAQSQVTEEASSSLDRTVFELERSNAILQLSKASSEDLNALRDEAMVIGENVDFLLNLVFLLVVALLVLGWRSHKQNQRIEQLETRRTEVFEEKE
ncbi:hypothetical protein Mar181_3005 [Marinomonas posidonica IVIA-Po-181]|uniref:Uncharacterized protein n=2 Tax=Marinomonas TaxID=28253 RepID=F6D1E3_MARPP|nr:hypothetical protein Mar181_3005 [Marinomonas posidonica IVIA-Po-181]